MTVSPGGSDEIEALRREAEALRSERPRRPSPPRAALDEPADAGAGASSTPLARDATEATPPHWVEEIGELADDLRDTVVGVQAFAQARPVLALLAAFGCGYLIGRLTSPRQEQ